MLDDKEAFDIAHQVLEYVNRLQNDRIIPPIPERFVDDPEFLNYHKKIVELRGVLIALTKGDLSMPITEKGFVAGYCKSLQAILRHLVWKVKQIEAENYDHNIDFFGELAVSFNHMALRLKQTTEALRQKEEALVEIASSLQREAKKRSEVLQELKKSEQRFKRLAQHDTLTGLLNRRAFFSTAEMGLESASSLNKACCVCLLDVDDFKKFNDTYGHLEGDRALQHVVKNSLSALRQIDIMGRYGGEEFVFLLTNIEEAYAYSAADRIRLNIEQHAFSLENGRSVPVTASIGVAVILPGKSKSGDYATKLRFGIAQADAALYEAKAQGKNRVCMAPLNP